MVDPGGEKPVLVRLQTDSLTLTAILITHKYGDHTGGVKALKQALPDIPDYGLTNETTSGATHKVGESDRISLDGSEFQVLTAPGHTEGRVAYFGGGALFCGDTLFAPGCGPVFTGTGKKLHYSLQRFAGLPPENLWYCGDEYTLDNLGFAKRVEPANIDIPSLEDEARSLQQNGKPTVPSLLSLELVTNPFLRTERDAVIQAAEKYAGRRLESEAEVLTTIRTSKDKEYD